MVPLSQQETLGKVIRLDNVRVLVVLLGFCLPGCGPGGSASTQEMVNHTLVATEALRAGDNAAAMESLNASIATKPTPWALFQRARLLSEEGKEAEALADCEQGLQLNQDDRNLNWLQKELKKPKAKRFQGKLANPPVKSI
jgi:tetratricopeptide (TPR) repeat protein